MNEEDIKNFHSNLNYQKDFFKNYIHQSITHLQPMIDKFTTKIFYFFKEDFEIYNKKDKLIVIFPNINFFANDIAPFYGVNINTIYYINLYDLKTDTLMELSNISESTLNKIKELEKQGIIIDTELAPHTKMSLVKDFVQKYADDKKEF